MESRFYVNVGEVLELEVYYPQNLRRYAGVWIENRGNPIIPEQGVLTGNGGRSRFSHVAEITVPEIVLKGYNTDPEYSHKIDIWLNIWGGGQI